jgi:hypothetical protein
MRKGVGEIRKGVGEMRKGVGERRRGAGEWISVSPVHPLCYGTTFLRLTPSFQHRSSTRPNTIADEHHSGINGFLE